MEADCLAEICRQLLVAHERLVRGEQIGRILEEAANPRLPRRVVVDEVTIFCSAVIELLELVANTMRRFDVLKYRTESDHCLTRFIAPPVGVAQGVGRRRRRGRRARGRFVPFAPCVPPSLGMRHLRPFQLEIVSFRLRSVISGSAAHEQYHTINLIF